jgi:hypothetical protein
MKHIISYTASKLNIPLIPVVQKRVSKKEYRNFNNKAELVDYLGSIRAGSDSKCMSITCNCGKIHDLISESDIPESSLICNCGRNLIIYGN